MSVDYSTQDFERSRGLIDAAARNADDNVRVKTIGDTTIRTTHRDPYSFYWELEQVRRRAEEPPRRVHTDDYVIEEEEVPQTAILSPDSGDSGVHIESHYSRPQKDEPPPMRQLPAGWEKHEGLCARRQSAAGAE